MFSNFFKWLSGLFASKQIEPQIGKPVDSSGIGEPVERAGLVTYPITDYSAYRPLRHLLPKLFGAIDLSAKVQWPRQEEFMKNLDVPHELHAAFKKDLVFCNRLMHAPLKQAFENIVTRGLVKQVKSYDGCFNIRNVRGGTSLSNHAYGLAIDINADTNPLGEVGDMSKELVACFKDAGFVWGGDFHSRKDPMHMEFVTEA